MPPRRSTRTQAKEDEKKKKDEMEEEEESEEEEEKTTKGKKGAAKGKAAAKKPAAKGKGRGKSKDESEEEESEEEEKPKRGGRGASKKAAPKGKGKRAASNSPSGSEDDEEEDDKKAPVKKGKGESSTSVKKVITKGGAAVDEHFDQDDCHVYQAGGVTYSKTLNQSNLQKNNNKFYIIQLLESDDKKTYYTFNRWGRVGYKGQLNSWSFDDPLDAVHDFTKKLREKKGRGYVEIDINYDDDDKKDASDEEDKKKTKAAPKGKGKKKDESEEEESEEEEVKKKATPKKADKKEDKEEEKKDVVKKVITKGGAAVDEYFDEKDCEVYMANGKVYAKTLNQSNLGQNNNKFYIIQILESTKNKGTFFVWNRWGRVGVKGQTMKKKVNSAAAAIEDFDKKFYDKTVKGDYVEIEINYDDENDAGKDDKDEEQKDDKADAKSKLPEQTKDLIKLIFDLKMMNNQMKEIGYDPSRMPLGKLSKNAIQKGYEVLKQLADAIEKKRSKDVLSQLSSQFYSQIPHDFGFKPMANFILDTDKKVKEKLEMLASLEDIQIATKLLDEGKNSSEDSLIDSNYAKLKCGLTPCDSKSDEFKMVLDYIKNTHASTHSSYSLELINLFAVEREGEAERYTKDIHNKQLLWHGSRLTNYVGILSQGLRIAPPEAPVTGYMFGKGVYFADMVSKSANYCFTNPQNNTGIMLLCEVALGNCNEKLHADYHAANLPPNKHSTKGCGRTAPAANGTKTVDGDVAVPMGKGENINLQGGALLYNEFIVYDVKQIKIRYLLRLKFNYRYNY